MPDPIKFADHAAQQSDRWLLMCILAIFFISVLWLLKWFVKKLDSGNEVIKACFEKSNDTALKVTEALTRTAGTVEQCNGHMREQTEVLRKHNDNLTYLARHLERERP